ncbi:carbamoyltransferase [Tessaracoccus bendigoensis DSM 12906]|uniref:Carbamoyltransferase n=1 Tax=Tessaracoccus bendigoensis DSM 12906 TaxID=1123357 RepID=A0A1M6LMJ8_9ACTN|nr:carbamoyltransferase C-terminal domain-containing protein [Tessaracoccus bendigoensis]SHJ72451.1 carbamoyltransferase [Tessaracoccus bendigoensis DSM 12906]
MTSDRGRHVVALGISGLNGAGRFRSKWLGETSDPAELRIYQGQDAAAAVVIDGSLVAAAQLERFSGRKFDGDFPAEPLQWCLEDAGLQWEDVTAIGHNFDFTGLGPMMRSTSLGAALYDSVYAPGLQTDWLRAAFPLSPESLHVSPVAHHRAHALFGAVASGLDEAGVLVVDGMGEAQAISIYRLHEGALHRVAAFGPRSSLGLWYSLITAHLGFLPNCDEYKVMGLAPWGDPDRFASAVTQTVTIRNADLSVPLLSWTDGNQLYTDSFAWLATNTVPRRGADEELTQAHADLAAAAQVRLSQALVHLAQMTERMTGSSRLVVCGGVALNCAAIGDVARLGLFDTVYVPPAPGDDGTAIGAAYALTLASAPSVKLTMPALPYLGPQPIWSRRPPTPDWVAPDVAALASTMARILAADAVVGWARGPLEFGPRALGGRSIFASPARTEMRDRVNAIVKEREAFRPLAPAVRAEDVDAWFDVPPGLNIRHMTATVPARADQRARIAAVVHRDGTSRIQAVHRAEAEDVWMLLSAFARETGLPMLLNTSLNGRGQPMVRSADQAYELFEQSSLDALVVENQVWVTPRFRRVLEGALEVDSAGGSGG